MIRQTQPEAARERSDRLDPLLADFITAMASLDAAAIAAAAAAQAIRSELGQPGRRGGL